MQTIQVTLIGGPADLQRHVIGRHFHCYKVAEIPSPIYGTFEADGDAPARMTCIVHEYRIRQVDHDVFVGIWQNPRNPR